MALIFGFGGSVGRFLGGEDHVLRSSRDGRSYLWVFRMPGHQISLLVGDHLVLRVSHVIINITGA